MRKITSISIIGTGNVAFHLGNALFEKGVIIEQVYGRNQQEASVLARSWNCKTTFKLSEINSDLVLVCVSDNAIIPLISQLPSDVNVAYTSGAVGLLNFHERKNVGVFYPLQTFSKSKSVKISEVPFLIEADSVEFAEDLFELAWKISDNLIFANSEDRKNYHLAAVFINNFTNHLIYQAKNHLDKNTLNWKLLLPLLTETIDKIKTIDPFDAQTGPARRKDLETIRSHEVLLEGIPKEIYTLITKSIIDTYHQNDKL